jgi:hypothetical protein
MNSPPRPPFSWKAYWVYAALTAPMIGILSLLLGAERVGWSRSAVLAIPDCLAGLAWVAIFQAISRRNGGWMLAWIPLALHSKFVRDDPFSFASLTDRGLKLLLMTAAIAVIFAIPELSRRPWSRRRRVDHDEIQESPTLAFPRIPSDERRL